MAAHAATAYTSVFMHYLCQQLEDFAHAWAEASGHPHTDDDGDV
jgi:hypothetical protein